MNREMRSWIHILIPYYSEVDYLKEAVYSVLKQSSNRWQLIVVDDCGNSSSEAQNFIEGLRNPSITYIRNPKNFGITLNWNRCLELSKSPYAMLLHSDDSLEPTYIESMLDLIESDKSAAIYFSMANVIGPKGKRVFSFPDFIKKFLTPASSEKGIVLQGEQGLAALLRGNFIFCPTMCYSLRHLDHSRFNPKFEMVQDLDFIARCLMKDLKIVGSTKKTYNYRRHKQSTTTKHTKSLKRFEEEISLYRSIESLCSSMQWLKARKVAATGRIIVLNLAYNILLDALGLRITSASSKFQLLRRTVSS